jgi:hypothetical protein
VSFADWVKNGWLVAHKSSEQEIANLLGIVARDLKDSQAKDVSDDWRFAIAYNAALQAATQPQDTAPAVTVITTESFSRWNSPWGKTRSSLVPSTHSVKRET